MRNGSNKCQQISLHQVLMKLVSVYRAIILKIRLSSNQQTATPGAGHPDEKCLQISAVAFVLVNRNWMINCHRNYGIFGQDLNT